MKVSCLTGRTFNRQVVFAGILILIAGILMVPRLGGILMILTGAFMIFTSERVRIHTDTRKIRSGTSLFGIIPTGRYRSLDDFTGLSVVQVSSCTTTYSLSNRRNTLQETEYRLYLTDRNHKPSLLVKKFRLINKATETAGRLSSLLDLPVLTRGEKPGESLSPPVTAGSFNS